jgi:hypothetical protein
MNQPPLEPFNDPELKAALRRAIGQEAAPAGLRDRIRAAADAKVTPEVKDAPPIKLRQPRGPLYRLAVAAILVIGFGGLAYRIWDMNRVPQYDQRAAIPDSLYQGMIKTHALRVASAAGDDSGKTLLAISGLSQKIKRPMFVPDLSQDGWTFQGAAVRDVDSNPSAQLFFTKGNASISVFSMPVAAAPGVKDGSDYQYSFASHPIAGFTRGLGLYCIVGSSADHSLGAEEVKRLLDRHKGEMTGG